MYQSCTSHRAVCHDTQHSIVQYYIIALLPSRLQRVSAFRLIHSCDIDVIIRTPPPDCAVSNQTQFRYALLVYIYYLMTPNSPQALSAVIIPGTSVYFYIFMYCIFLNGKILHWILCGVSCSFVGTFVDHISLCDYPTPSSRVVRAFERCVRVICARKHNVMDSDAQSS